MRTLTDAGIASSGSKVDMTNTMRDPASLPLVSIIVPTHNYATLITETLESIQRQTYERWECIIVDDGSTDDTAEVVARIAKNDSRIRYIWQPNQLQSVAKNTGISEMQGEFLQFLDADDFIEPWKLERQVAYLEAHPEVDVVYGGVRFFRTSHPDERLHSMADDSPWMPNVSGKGGEVLRALVHENIMVINSPLVRREVVEKVGPFDEKLPPAEDWDYWLRCALAGASFRFADIEGTLALVRSHAVSSSRNRIRMYRSMLRIRKKLANSLNDRELQTLNRERRVINEGDLALEEVELGSKLRGASHFAKAAFMDRKWKGRMKWLSCAAAAPFINRRRLEGMIASSITQLVKDHNRKDQAA